MAMAWGMSGGTGQHGSRDTGPNALPRRCPRCRGRMFAEPAPISYDGETEDLVCIACGYREITGERRPPPYRRRTRI